MRRHTMPSPLPSPSMSSLNRHLTPVAAPRPRASHAPVAVRPKAVAGGPPALAPGGVVGAGGAAMRAPALGEAGSLPAPVQRRRSEVEQQNDPHRHLTLSPLPDMTRVAHRRRIQVCWRVDPVCLRSERACVACAHMHSRVCAMLRQPVFALWQRLTGACGAQRAAAVSATTTGKRRPYAPWPAAGHLADQRRAVGAGPASSHAPGGELADAPAAAAWPPAFHGRSYGCGS